MRKVTKFGAGGGLAAAGLQTPVRHPVELLDDAYRAAGRYE